MKRKELPQTQTETTQLKQIKLTSINWIDANILLIISSFLSLKSQLKLRLVSINFNEIIMNGITFSKIVIDYLKYWNETVLKEDKNVFYLQWTFGAQLKCNGFIENVSITSKENVFFTNEIHLFKEGIVEITEFIEEQGVCERSYGTFCKLKWNIEKNKINTKSVTSITFIQHFFQNYCNDNSTVSFRYVLGFYKDNSEKEFTGCLIDINCDNGDILEIINEDIFKEIRTFYCNSFKDLKEFLRFLMKCAKCESNIMTSIIEGIGGNNSLTSDIEDYPFYEHADYITRDSKNDMDCFCKALQHVIYVTKNISLKHLLKNNFKFDSVLHKEKDENIMKQLREQVQDVKVMKDKNSCIIINEMKENGIATLYLKKLNKFISIRYSISCDAASNIQNSKRVVLYYKELSTAKTEFKCFYDLYSTFNTLEENRTKIKENEEYVKKLFEIDVMVSSIQFIRCLLSIFVNFKVNFCNEKGISVDLSFRSELPNYFDEFRINDYY
ncbi:hypothetical protein ABK040_013708 [Willaertia magna]